MTADDLIAAARQCVGAPFRHQGRKVETGLDCAGVVIRVAAAVGVEVLDVDGYGPTPNDGQLERTLDAQPCLEQVASPADRQPGDVLLMRFTAEPQHLAICAGTTIIHAYEAAGICCEHDLSPTWAARIVRVYRFLEMAP